MQMMVFNRNPTVNVIVPVFNVEKHLCRCVKSIANQTYENIRVWLIDDGSTDSCPSLCDSFADRDARIVAIHKKNGGQASARNEGLDRVFSLPEYERGDCVVFVDSDDWVEPDYVEFLVGVMQETDANIVQCGHWITYSEVREVDKDPDHSLCILSEREAMESILRNGKWDVTAWNKLYRLKVFEALRFPEGIYYEDTAIAPYLLRDVGQVAIRMNPKYHYVQRYDSTANGVSWTDRKYDFISVGDEAASFVLSRLPGLSAAAMEKRVFVRLSTLSQMVNTRHFDRERADEMRDFIVANARTVLFDPLASKRDKFGVVAISLGFRFYQAIWTIYYKITRRPN